MNVRYSKRFLKQLAQVPSQTRKKVEKFAFEDLPSAASVAEIGKIEYVPGIQPRDLTLAVQPQRTETKAVSCNRHK